MANWQERIKKSLENKQEGIKSQEAQKAQLAAEAEKKSQEKARETAKAELERQKYIEGVSLDSFAILEKLGVNRRLNDILREVWRDGQIAQDHNVFSTNYLHTNMPTEDGKLHISYFGLKFEYRDTDLHSLSDVIHASSMGEQYTSRGGSGFYYITTKASQLLVACAFNQDSGKKHLQVIDKFGSNYLYRDDFLPGGSRVVNSISLDESENMVIGFMEDQLLQSCVSRTNKKLLPADLKQRGRANIASNISFFDRIFRSKR